MQGLKSATFETNQNPLVAVHHFCLTKGFQKTPNRAIYRSERHLTIFYIAQIVPCCSLSQFFGMGWPYPITAAIKNPSQELNNDFCFGFL